MTLLVENLYIPRNPNPNPNHEKIIPKILTLNITLIPGPRAQERHIA